MAGYRRVNYYELCRLCTSSEGTKMHIFREEGRRRQLPTKIQICLPVQVCEDDSLPKIICNHCVEKLESFYDFRESCVNAEAMLESYFTSLRYSDDFTREGKVYVKDESSTKKKTADNDSLAKHHHKSSVTASTDGLNSLVQAASIQIVSDADGTRVQQYKCQMQMQPGNPVATVVEAAATEARYSYETCTNSPRNNENPAPNSEVGVSQQVSKVEDGSTQCSETDFNNKSPENSDEGEVTAHQHQQAATVAFATAGPGQEMLLHFNFNKERDGFLRSEDQAALQRSSIAQIGEFLRMKTANIVDGTAQSSLVEIAGNVSRPCNRCGKIFSSIEELQTHSPCQENSDASDKNGGPGCNYSCEVCGKPFKRKEHLFQHRKLHTGERPYICSVCGKAFSRKEHLVRHAVSHTGQKMHSCDMCGKSFSRKDNLHKHRKTHGISGPYICETCGKSFVVKHYYLLHKGSHSSCSSAVSGEEQNAVNTENSLMYKCDMCSKSFGTKQNLLAHKLRHRNKTPPVSANPTLHNVSQQQTPVQLESSVGEPHTVALSHNAAPLTTINNSALLAPNILHHVNTPVSGAASQSNAASAAMIQVSSSAAAYLCTPGTVATNELLESYRRMHST
ncbi:zinc finger protein 85-like [Schistocerca americana]|uniref:zinc finger protein 85-like n=1 Tax=Schistocerca americana TaxID=7009 RepID=UPI001F503383|nr:zinc finger protein 85-like [Schistocerca americana]XP_047103120.1 zinc finger protein 85-like [Schistocerca piceifrons]XP_049782012.1 zinc finger protein 85-like [Schistocerca cancellata]XP_049845608.1 zinc finger protein 85-like [Schistocerca gregaria]XP_049954418.1 zinc finger protein 85-like [Schistocerca serialis cubense]